MCISDTPTRHRPPTTHTDRIYDGTTLTPTMRTVSARASQRGPAHKRATHKFRPHRRFTYELESAPRDSTGLRRVIGRQQRIRIVFMSGPPSHEPYVPAMQRQPSGGRSTSAPPINSARTAASYELESAPRDSTGLRRVIGRQQRMRIVFMPGPPSHQPYVPAMQRQP